MQSNFPKNTAAEAPWLVIHPLNRDDAIAVAALRSVVAPMKGKVEGTAGRGPFNDIMEGVAVPEGVAFEADTVGGIAGWWAKPGAGPKGGRDHSRAWRLVQLGNGPGVPELRRTHRVERRRRCFYP